MDTKCCTKCKETRPVEDFHRKGTGRRARCKHCLSKEARLRYKRDPKRRGQISKAVLRRRKKLDAFIRELKDQKPCTDCGNAYPYYVMDFDHVGDKEVNVSQITVRKGWSEERILKELDQCELVCANCHRERTFKRQIPLAG